MEAFTTPKKKPFQKRTSYRGFNQLAQSEPNFSDIISPRVSSSTTSSYTEASPRPGSPIPKNKESSIEQRLQQVRIWGDAASIESNSNTLRTSRNLSAVQSEFSHSFTKHHASFFGSEHVVAGGNRLSRNKQYSSFAVASAPKPSSGINSINKLLEAAGQIPSSQDGQREDAPPTLRRERSAHSYKKIEDGSLGFIEEEKRFAWSMRNLGDVTKKFHMSLPPQVPPTKKKFVETESDDDDGDDLDDSSSQGSKDSLDSIDQAVGGDMIDDVVKSQKVLPKPAPKKKSSSGVKDL